MSILTRYLVRQNLFLIFTILLIGIGIYLLAELFDRIDNFLDANLGFMPILLYLVAKIPIIISQILPAVFLLALLVQLNLLTKNKEIIALYAGGISPLVLFRFILIYGIVWAGCQFMFAEVVGVKGSRVAATIWKEQVKGRDLKGRSIVNTWFVEKDNFIFVSKAYPELGRGELVRIYSIDTVNHQLTQVTQGASFTIENKSWRLTNVTQVDVTTNQTTALAELSVPIRQSLKGFLVTDASTPPEQLSVWELGATIKRLQTSGIKVEALQTVWHHKIAYSCSIIIMGLLALIITQRVQNIYKSVGIGLFCIFFFYAMTTVLSNMGKEGLLKPVLAGWGIIGFSGSLLVLAIVVPFLLVRNK